MELPESLQVMMAMLLLCGLVGVFMQLSLAHELEVKKEMTGAQGLMKGAFLPSSWSPLLRRQQQQRNNNNSKTHAGRDDAYRQEQLVGLLVAAATLYDDNNADQPRQ